MILTFRVAPGSLYESHREIGSAIRDCMFRDLIGDVSALYIEYSKVDIVSAQRLSKSTSVKNFF